MHTKGGRANTWVLGKGKNFGYIDIRQMRNGVPMTRKKGAAEGVERSASTSKTTLGGLQ